MFNITPLHTWKNIKKEKSNQEYYKDKQYEVPIIYTTSTIHK